MAGGRTFTSTADYVRHLENRLSVVESTTLREHARAVGKIKRYAQSSLLSGGRSARELARAGHPYARRHGGVGNPLPINAQTGQLRESARVVLFVLGDRRVRELGFYAPHARFALAPGGTARTVDRRFWEALNTYAVPVLARSGIAALLRAHRSV